jgi:hypothetical protein
MTIAISLVVGDGVVIGTDSATSIILPGEKYHNIYSNAEKSINLVKGLPIGLMTYGIGSLGMLSIASHARVLRQLLSGDADAPVVDASWALDPRNYTMEDVANRTRQFFFGTYSQWFGTPPAAGEDGDEEEAPVQPAEGSDPDPVGPAPKYPPLGLVLAGFSAGSYYPEVWSIEIDDGMCPSPMRLVSEGQAPAVNFWAQPEALTRLVYGYSEEVAQRLLDAGLPIETVRSLLLAETPLAHAGMPIQDAIDLVRYLADVTAGYLRFKPGAPVVGPPIDIAVITRHQGFRWVSRKHYYTRELNVDEPFTVITQPARNGETSHAKPTAPSAVDPARAGKAGPTPAP